MRRTQTANKIGFRRVVPAEPMPVHHLVRDPFDLFFVDCPSASPAVAKDLCYAQMKELERKYLHCIFRGVALDRFEAIARNYVDVEPTNAVIFADGLEKALEYGDWPKVVLVLRREFVKSSFRYAPGTTSEADLEIIRRDYPTLVRLDDGSFWLSRMREDDRRIATAYESAYGWYIPGDPKEALAALLLCCRPEDLPVARDFINRFRTIPSAPS